MGLLFVSTQLIYTQESQGFEKIRDLSPDGKFALRISCSSEAEDPDTVGPNLLTAAPTHFTAVENRGASNHVKEKHPIQRIVHL